MLDAYPEFHHNLGAFAILKDAILIGRMSSNETVKEIAKHYPILIRSAEFVTKTMKEYLTSNKQDNNLSNTMPSEYYKGYIHIRILIYNRFQLYSV